MSAEVVDVSLYVNTLLLLPTTVCEPVQTTSARPSPETNSCDKVYELTARGVLSYILVSLPDDIVIALLLMVASTGSGLST